MKLSSTLHLMMIHTRTSLCLITTTMMTSSAITTLLMLTVMLLTTILSWVIMLRPTFTVPMLLILLMMVLVVPTRITSSSVVTVASSSWLNRVRIRREPPTGSTRLVPTSTLISTLLLSIALHARWRSHIAPTMLVRNWGNIRLRWLIVAVTRMMMLRMYISSLIPVPVCSPV